jgi:DNA-3-methyladenine glycosylase I
MTLPGAMTKWGVPVHEDRKWYEFIVLDGAQAGLSWDTVLGKRENYRKVFDGFDPAKVARYDKRKLERLLADPGIIRNRLKINSAITNAKAFVKLQEELGSFDEYIWAFVDGSPKMNRWKSPKEIPTRTPISDAMSKDLKQRGFNFVGTTICYAFMQAAGMVNDHLVACFRHAELCGKEKSPLRNAGVRI